MPSEEHGPHIEFTKRSTALPVIPETDDSEKEQVPLQENELQAVNPEAVNAWIRALLRWGTPACGVFCGVVGIVIAVLILTIGFWKTLLVTAICAVCAFIGGVGDKTQWLKDTINRLFPPRDQA